MTDTDGQLEKETEQSIADDAAEQTVAVATDAIAKDGIANGEIRAVEAPPTQGKRSLLFALLLLVVLLGGGFYLISGTVTSRTPQQGAATDSVLPKRYSIDKVAEEVIDSEQVAAIESVPQKAPAAVATKTVAAVEKRPQTVAPAASKGKVNADFKPVAKAAAPLAASYQVQVGPYLYVVDTKKAADKLEKLGYRTEKTDGHGMVSMIRLLEGTYPATAARTRLAEVKQQVGDAFLLPSGDMLAIYVGSFSDRERAARYAQKLAGQGVIVTPVNSEIEMSGKMFIAAEAELTKAREIAAKISSAGFTAQVVRK